MRQGERHQRCQSERELEGSANWPVVRRHIRLLVRMARTYLFRQIIRAGEDDCWAAGCLVFLEVEIELEGGGGGEAVDGTAGTCAPSLSSLAAACFFFAMPREQKLTPAASCNDSKEKVDVS